MDRVYEPDHTNGSAWYYGKGKNILVDNIKKNPKLGKSKNIIARKGKAAKKLMKNSSKTAVRTKQGFTQVSANTTYREARPNSRSARKENMIQIIRPYFRN